MSWVFILFASAIAVAPGGLLIAIGLGVRRSRSRVVRVPINAVLVSRTNFTNPSKVTFDYPGPDGRWLRATRFEGLSPVRGRWRWVPGTTVWRPEPGAPLTVWVDPQRPHDVSLGESTSYSGFMSIALIVGGSIMLMYGLSVLANFLGAAR